jgi:hypothetical protein
VLLIGQTALAQDANTAPEFIYYDYIDEHGLLNGGMIKIEPNNPLHSKYMAGRKELVVQQPPDYNVVTIINNGPTENRIDMVFLGDGYRVQDLGQYANDVNAVIAGFFAQSPFNEYASYFNVYRVDVDSNEQGISNDPCYYPGVTRDTALRMRFDNPPNERRLYIADLNGLDAAYAAADLAPDSDEIMDLGNTDTYGGSGRYYIDREGLACLAGANVWRVDTALHEFGHSFTDLADEYNYPPTYDYNDSDVLSLKANTSTDNAQEMWNGQTKWYRWLDTFALPPPPPPPPPPQPLPLGFVYAFPGATVWNVTTGNYVAYRSGVYRPTDLSKMRVLGNPFYGVNVEQFVLEIYRIVNPIDDATPEGSYPTTATFFVTPIQPVGRNLDIQWYLDGNLISEANDSNTLDASTLNLSPVGIYTLEVRVVDNTTLVRDEGNRPIGARQWTLADCPPEERLWPGDLDCSYSINFQDFAVLADQWLQQPPVQWQWQRTFGGSALDYGYSVQQTSDGGYIITGWANFAIPIPPQPPPSPFTGFPGRNTDVYLIKTGSNGISQWERTFGGSGNDVGYSVQQTSDGGYIIAGTTGAFGDPNGNVYLIKTEPNGNSQWERTFGGSSFDEGRSVQQTIDGGYIIAGLTSSFGAGFADVYLIKTDPNGDSEWQRTFGGSGNEVGYSVQQTSDGGYIIAGTYSFRDPTNGKVYLIKTDPNGDSEWQRTFGGSGYDEGYSVQQTSDGGYIIAGATDSFGAGGVYLIKTDSDGNSVWQRAFGVSGADVGYSVQQTSDGGYIIAGTTYSFGEPNGNVYLIKTDSDGNNQWERTFGGSSYDYSYSVQQTSDGGYIIAGLTSSFGAGAADVYLIKLFCAGAYGDLNGDCTVNFEDLAILAENWLEEWLLPPETLVTPTVVVPQLTHEFVPPSPPFFPLGYVRDRWAQNGNGPSFQANLTDYNTVGLRLSAGQGRRFSVELPSGVSEVWMTADIFWRRLGFGDSSRWPDSSSVTLEGLTGGPAVQDYFYAYVGEQGNVINTCAIFRIQGDITFTEIRATCTYNGGISVPDETKTYTLEDGETDIIFSYSTQQTTDPGVFARIE